MTIINTATDNEYALVKRETFQVTNSFDKSLFTSANLHDAIWHVLESERVFMIYNFSHEFLSHLREKLSSFNILNKITDNPLYVRDLLSDTQIHRSYYDNLLIRIYQSFLGHVEIFEFDPINDFHVFDEFADTVKKKIKNQRHFATDPSSTQKPK